MVHLRTKSTSAFTRTLGTEIAFGSKVDEIVLPPGGAASIAEKWFGDWRGAVGRTVELGSFRGPLLITGVFKDMPVNTEFPLESRR